MKPANWPETLWTQILAILAAYIYKWSGEDSLAPLSPEARDEIRSRIMLDILTGTPPEGIAPLHYVFRVARQWRVRGWNGDCELNRQRMRAERNAARKALRDPGSMESEEGRNKSPFAGMSDDARQPTPLAQLIAVEEFTRAGLWHTSDRQRKARRKPVKGTPAPVAYRCTVTGFAGKPRAGWGKGGRPLYFTGARTLIAWVPVGPPAEERGAYDPKTRTYRPYVSHTGTVANRAIGKVRSPAIGRDPVGLAMARMAIVGRDARRHFTPAPMPAMLTTEGLVSRKPAGRADGMTETTEPGERAGGLRHYVAFRG